MNSSLTSMPRSTRLAAAVGGALVGLFLVAQPAYAHTGLPTNGLVDGILHPLEGVDHLLAMVAVGVLAVAAKDRRIAWLTPIGFIAGMLVGGAIGLAGVEIAHVETVIALSVVVLGIGVVAITQRAGMWLPVVAATFGSVHGFAHGGEQPAGSSAGLYVAGFVVVTAGLHLSGTALGLALRRAAVLRVAGGALVSSAGVALLIA